MASTSFEISQFTSKLSNGGARPNLFKATLGNVPSNAALAGPNATSDFSFMCKTVSGIPASTLGTIIVPYFGREVKFAGDREFGEITTTIINDENMNIRRMLESWINSFSDVKANKASMSMGNRSAFSTVLTLDAYKKQGTIDQTWKFEKCWPSVVSSIDLNWDSTNSIQEYSVSWQYDFYTHDKAFKKPSS
tara:strand:+ start:6264 stop:6839 length:576 start_codon:yes stop_codon:yes gene_type:complete